MDSPSVFMENGNLIIRASALGMCMKRLVAEKMGYDPQPTPDWLQKRFDGGHAAEETLLLTLGLPYDDQVQVELKVGMNLIIRGHVDGLAKDCVLEAKFLAPSSYAKVSKPDWLLKNFPMYAWQASVYMYATKKPMKMVIGKRGENDEIAETHVVTFTEAPVSMADIIKRAHSINAATILPTCDFRNFPCPYSYLETDEDTQTTTLLPEDAILLQGLLNKWRKAKKEIEIAEAEKKAAWEGIKGLLADNMCQKANGLTEKVTWVRQVTKNVDWKEVPEDLMEQIEKFKTVETIREYPKITTIRNAGNQGSD